MALDGQGNAFVVGRTTSEDFVVSANAYRTGKSTTGLQYNVVVTKFDASGTLIYSTYLGGSTGSDIGWAIAVDAAGNAYITGNTTSRDFPVTPKELGLIPVKVNAVIIRGINDHEIESLAGFAREQKLSIRFIEFMPLDSARAWLRELVVPGREILGRLQARHALQPVASANRSETSRRWAFADGRGEIGIIAPVTEPFCGHCNRLRLTADGKIRTCLFSLGECDLKPLLRGGASDEEIAEKLRAIVWQKEERHHIGEPDFVQPARSMSCIGG